jgi:hypothetical protein
MEESKKEPRIRVEAPSPAKPLAWFYPVLLFAAILFSLSSLYLAFRANFDLLVSLME